MSALEQSFRDLAEQQGLASLCVTLLRADHCPEGWFNVTAQREVGDDRLCGTGSDDSINAAVLEAIASLNGKATLLADESLLEQAA